MDQGRWQEAREGPDGGHGELWRDQKIGLSHKKVGVGLGAHGATGVFRGTFKDKTPTGPWVCNGRNAIY